MPFAVLKACRWAEQRVAPRVRHWEVRVDQVQGVLVHGHEELPHAAYLLVDFGAVKNFGASLDALRPARTLDTALDVALGYRLLARLALPESTLQAFDPAFRQGMTHPVRAQRLGDEDASHPERWIWGGPNNPPYDALLMLFGRTSGALDALRTRVHELLATLPGARVVCELGSELLPGRREHFGYRSGIAQPHLASEPRVPPLGVFGPSDPQNQLAPGEFVLGYTNEFIEFAPSPHVSSALDRAGHLPAARGDSAAKDLGRDGSYLVLRQLSQDVAGFWRALSEAAPSADECERLAAKLVGRWRSGAPLVVAPDGDRPELADYDDFGYAELDPLGRRCPLGAHIRRANPRDWRLAPEPTRAVAMSNHHRLIRRSRPYGPPLGASFEIADLLAARDDGIQRGLLFACFNADIARQYELVQEAWLNNPCLGGLRGEADPLLGSSDTFSVPSEPVSRRYSGLSNWVQARGGGYFFLPSTAALRFLAALSLEKGKS